jgi:hypothetical protein
MYFNLLGLTDKFILFIDKISAFIHYNHTLTTLPYNIARCINQCHSKKANMNVTFRRKKGLISFAVLLVFSLMACQKQPISFGEQFVENHTNIVSIDTLTPRLTTYKLDSFTTSGSGTVSVGAFIDPVFGTTTSGSYFRVTVPSVAIPFDALYDSLCLIMVPTGTVYGDTTVQQQINVYELNESLELPEGRNAFYNISHFSTKPDGLGSISFVPRPSRKDTLFIRLSDEKGMDLFQKFQNKANEISTTDAFLRYFKGLKVSPQPGTTALMNYTASDSSLKMRLYYREPGVTLAQKYIDFTLTNPNLQFNQLTTDRSGTPLQGLPPGYPEIPSANLNDAAYVQYSTGLIGKLSFPSLQDLLNIDKAGKILKAELIIKPVEGTFADPFSLPRQLTIALTDKNNSMGPVVSTANVQIDYLYGDNTGYTFDISSYLQQQIRVNFVNQNGLLIFAPAGDFNRLVIGDRNHPLRSRTQVKINYVVVK